MIKNRTVIAPPLISTLTVHKAYSPIFLIAFSWCSPRLYSYIYVSFLYYMLYKPARINQQNKTT